MVAVTFGQARVPAAEAAAKPARAAIAAPRQAWYVRFFNAMIEARMAQASREVRMHTRLMDYSFDDKGNRVVKTETGNMPFGGW